MAAVEDLVINKGHPCDGKTGSSASGFKHLFVTWVSSVQNLAAGRKKKERPRRVLGRHPARSTRKRKEKKQRADNRRVLLVSANTLQGAPEREKKGKRAPPPACTSKNGDCEAASRPEKRKGKKEEPSPGGFVRKAALAGKEKGVRKGPNLLSHVLGISSCSRGKKKEGRLACHYQTTSPSRSQAVSIWGRGIKKREEKPSVLSARCFLLTRQGKDTAFLLSRAGQFTMRASLQCGRKPRGGKRNRKEQILGPSHTPPPCFAISSKQKKGKEGRGSSTLYTRIPCGRGKDTTT